jgi:ABC-type uncharacterized transport system ATPase subunit
MERNSEYNQPMVDVNNVSMNFSTVEAVKEISFRVSAGSIFGLVGSDPADDCHNDQTHQRRNSYQRP